MTNSQRYPRPTLDLEYNRERAAQLHSEMAHALLSKGITIVTPSRRTMRSLGLAFVVATGAFWTMMTKHAPQPNAAALSPAAGVFSPLSLAIPPDLPSGDYATN